MIGCLSIILAVSLNKCRRCLFLIENIYIFRDLLYVGNSLFEFEPNRIYYAVYLLTYYIFLTQYSFVFNDTLFSSISAPVFPINCYIVIAFSVFFLLKWRHFWFVQNCRLKPNSGEEVARQQLTMCNTRTYDKLANGRLAWK